MYVIPKEGYLISARISLAEFLDAPEDTCFVTMREPSTQDFVRLQMALESGELSRQMEVYAELFPKLIIDHDFYADPAGGDAKKLTPEALVARLQERADIFLHLVRRYSEEVLFTRGKKIAGS